MMNRRVWTTILGLSIATAALAQTKPKAPELCVGGNCFIVPPTRSDAHPSGYNLVFSDEFTGTSLDRTQWCTRYLYGGGPPVQIRDPECQRPGEGTRDFLNDEQQRYVDINQRGEIMHVLKDGVLTMRATKTRTDPAAPYESAMLRSKRLFAPTPDVSYYITARLLLPNVRGTWPAFWLNSDRRADGTASWPPEIDIFEGALNEKEDTANMLHMSVVVRDGLQTQSRDDEMTFSAPEFDRTWKNYVAPRSLRNTWIDVAVEWTFNNVCYFVDGSRVMCENYSWVYNDGTAAAPAHILVNLAVGGKWAGRHGVDADSFPTSMLVDHVRVYEKRR